LTQIKIQSIHVQDIVSHIRVDHPKMNRYGNVPATEIYLPYIFFRSTTEQY